MASGYSGAIDTTATFPADVTDDTDSRAGTPRTGTVGFLAQWMRDVGDALIAIETENGVDPSGSFASIALRFNARLTCRKTADQNFTSLTAANVSDLSLPATVGVDHMFRFLVPWSSATSGVGIGFGVTCPALGTGGYISYVVDILRSAEPAVGTAPSATAGMLYSGPGTSSGDTVTSDAPVATGTVVMARIEGVLSNPSAAGTLQLTSRVEAAGTVTVKKGAWGEVYLN